jgi:pyruvate/2-oxoglutarate dehydrogenase complex dihydrolipoamide acyltransferase (E2) component
MTNIVIMPQLGETVAEGTILKWFESVGDEIKEGDNLFEVETDQVTLEVQSILSERLHEIRVGEGVVAKVGVVVAVIGGEAVATAPAPAKTASAPVVGTAPPRSPFEEVTTPLDKFGSAKSARVCA